MVYLIIVFVRFYCVRPNFISTKLNKFKVLYTLVVYVIVLA